MQRRASTICLVGVFVCAVLTAAWLAVSPAQASELALTEVAPGVFVHQGRHVGVEDPARGDSANIGFIVGQSCVAVVDTGGSLATGRALRAAIARTTTVPVCFVINTHAHFDHVLGNPAFAEDGRVRFVGHQLLPDALADSEAFFRKEFAPETAGAPTPMFAREGVWVETEASLDLGGRVLRLKAEPPAHSAADLTVFDEKTSTLWSGDLVFMERLPVLDGNLRSWLKWLATTGTQGIARVVPGHGPASAPWPQALASERTYLEAVQAAAGKAAQDGEFLEDLTARAAEHPPANWQVTEPHARNMARAFREQEWN